MIKLWAVGNPGNLAMMYMTALQLQQRLGLGRISNVSIPLFDIHHPDLKPEGHGLHNRLTTNNLQNGYVPLRGLAHAAEQSAPSFISLEGYSQHLANFPPRSDFDYERLFPPLESAEGGSDDELVINIRGSEILTGLHADYVLLPPEFYQYLIELTGKKPVFYGQLDPSPYLQELKERFPQATFIPSRGVAQDFDYLRKSRHIVPSLSTFSWLACWLSEARTIHFPIAGVLNPQQHTLSMLLPLDDPRYRFYEFPLYYSLPVAQYRDYLDPVRTNWAPVTPSTVKARLPSTLQHIDDQILAFSPWDYLHMHPEKDAFYRSYGDVGLYNDFMNDDLLCGRAGFTLDRAYYARLNVGAALAVARGEYTSLEEHYYRVGQYGGLSKRP
ncbi:hypothetical protein [Oecophyllibacter saccharovorans]|uniref:hypothetical protein n=1 Tax=Oecophyllibacter saccharovorans TaxID=2558360 RepID=UPI001F4FE7E4|nr:hypothetical protein [Oecophyllibacter saccharovorans]